MKFIDEVDIELVNQELNFQSLDSNLIIKGGCDLFTTKPIGSDRKLFKTIDKHLDQIIEDNQLSRSVERERKNSINSIFGSSSSPPLGESFSTRRGSYATITEKDRRGSSSQVHFNKSVLSTSLGTPSQNSLLSKSLSGETSFDNEPIDESPFGPLKNVTTRKTFAYLIAILNTSFPDHDFSNLQPTTENFHRILNPEDLIHKFNNIMISLGKKEDLLNWIWDTVNVYMDIIPSRTSPYLAAQSGASSTSRKNSFNNNHNSSNSSYTRSGSFSSNGNNSPPHTSYEHCQIYQFQPSDESILEDLNYPYQTMWSYYWFIYNKKKKRVSFIYLTAINKLHYSMVNNHSSGNGSNGNVNGASGSKTIGDDDDDDDEMYLDEYMDEDVIIDDDDAMDDNNDVIGDLEI
ncbi:Maf1 regulator-domain-containing protein [Scheffersomyces xylosifermentans]|uniref:Maf1 regulator-domain-containing protein n=1 Tax=Scheffersomyces xylosifermentans TaxID=1304137 RepID=UPI00315D0A50